MFDYPFTGDCPHCKGTRFAFRPHGGSKTRMAECPDCRRWYPWTFGSWNTLSDRSRATRMARAALLLLFRLDRLVGPRSRGRRS